LTSAPNANGAIPYRAEPSSWHRTSKINHNINFINLNYARLIDSTSLFQDLIEQSSLIEQSYRSQVIMGPSYTFTYNNTLDQHQRFRTYYRANIETAGNLLQGMYALAGNREQDNAFLGVPFSQYVRIYSDFRAYYQVGMRKTTVLAFRNSMGWGAAYGNSMAVPYTRQFFIGGSNSLRPITARVVGPGRYLEFDEAAYNQVGDIKIENNLEFRFKIWYIFHGALWSDVGNIWLLTEDPERPGSGIRWNQVFQDSYFTSGLGLRVDLNFLVVRADYGAIMYLPFLNQGYRWLWQNELPLHGLVFGIGYPF
jgi:outer membrane protein assembly factor BamA